MTKNQIEYNKLVETRRANIAQEDLTRMRDQAAREAKLIELGESRRHNLAGEALSQGSLRVQEGTLAESVRHNQRGEAISSAQLSESQRHNKASEAATLIDLSERGRHNLATEQAQLIDLDERSRHNQVVEAETKRHNVVGEAEDAARTALQSALGYQSNAETARHNKAMESKDYSTRVYNNNTSVPPSQPQPAPDVDFSEVPRTENDGRFYWSRPTQGGNFGGSGQQRQLMYAISSGPDAGWYKVQEDKQGRQYIYTQSGKKKYVG